MTITKMDRREFVKLGMAAGGGLILGVSLPGLRSLNGASGKFQPSAFLAVEPDGTVTIWMARADMGQGVTTALPMIVADELDADWSRVKIVRAGAHPEKYGRQMTVGSSSVRNGAWMPLRQAGAAGRAMLVAAAAARWGVPAPECETKQGRVLHPATGRALGYGELAEAAAALPVPRDPKLKDSSKFTLIGTSPPLVDTEAKVTGKAAYGMDARVPGMLYATIRRPPVFGASLAKVDDAKARAVPGVRDVVTISTGVVVIAEHTWAAFQGTEALDITWAPGEFQMSSAEIDRHHAKLTESPGAVARDEGDAAAALNRATHRVEAEYRIPYLAHATMEPMNCTAHVRRDSCEIWAPTQNPQGTQSLAAELTGLPIEKVTVHVTYLGCGWGRRGRTDYARDAVETSMKVGAPVQVVWTREEDMRQDQYRPAAHARLRGGVDERGRISGLEIRVAAPPIGVQSGRGRGGGVDRNAVTGIANVAYTIPDFRVEYCRSHIPVPTGYWRSVGPSGNTFIIESFIDELAHAAGRDPLELRLEMLDGDPRLKRVLELAAEKAGWGTPLPAGRARGIGLVNDKGGRVAEVAEVSIQDGKPRVHRVTCAADCGQVIHPGVVETQISGSVIAGLTAALYGEITLEDGRVVQGNFDDYGMVRMPEAPEIEVHLVESREEPGGAGEPGVPPIAPAVANALLALTGKPVRSLPIRLS